MATSERSVGSDQGILYQTGLHWVVLLPPAIVGAVLAAGFLPAQPTAPASAYEDTVPAIGDRLAPVAVGR